MLKKSPSLVIASGAKPARQWDFNEAGRPYVKNESLKRVAYIG
jgi:hypothetical protein